MNGGIRVLLIDDEVDFLEVTAKRLERRGYLVDTAETCADALRALGERGVDVVVLDVMLPDRDGLECLKDIRGEHPGSAVILLTGHASMRAGMASLDLGASDYCLKPVDLDELVDRIEIVYRDSRAG